jgi:ATP-dependent exoDNAse (exonuclease V) beta subunit
VYWDPRALPLARDPLVGVRREDVLAGADEAVVEGDLAAHHAFEADRARRIEEAARPSAVVVTVTERSGDEAPRRSVELVALPRPADRPRGARFGTLVHAVFATVPLDADRATVDAIAALEGRILGATAAEILAAASAVAAALAHPIFARARAAEARGGLRRETPLCEAGEDGAILEGVVDLAFEEGGAWTVVDFKTDAFIEHELERYERQVALYADVIARATGARATPVLLWV